VLKDRSAALQAEIDSFRHRNSLMNPRHLDPDIVTERARALLNMANADDILIMVEPSTGKPISGKFQELIDDQLIQIIEADSTL
jgi:cell division protein FtsB